VARRTAERPGALTEAFKVAVETAGLTQEQLAERLGVHQTTVSKWLLGKAQPPLEHLPTIDALCGQPKGHVLRLAGYVEDIDSDVLAAIAQDPHLSEDGRASVTQVYGVFRRRSKASSAASAQPDDK
jgi:transcriptional regulator with XRE-family HTH domain